MRHATQSAHSRSRGLYDPELVKDNCGFGLIAQMDDQASHWLVHTAITALARLTHRGAVAADGKSGDGCGLLLKRPDAFLREAAEAEGISLDRQFAVGMVFLAPEETPAQTQRQILTETLETQGLQVSGWRAVPTNSDACGPAALKTMPWVAQVFVTPPRSLDEASFERRLFVARRLAEQRLASDPWFYVASLSSRVIAYKGLVMPDNLAVFYPDLGSERLASSLAVFHQRFSTNTAPQWRLAQPFRLLAHNGEINTIQGNRNWARARSPKFRPRHLPELESLQPLVALDGSDSSSLDNMLELLMAGGMDMLMAMRVLIPPAWQNAERIDPRRRALFEYYAMQMEPWDGPAGIVMTDGRYAACTLDRNGLRPARWVMTEDRHITLASEIGVYDYAAESVVAKGRVRPGELFAVDTHEGQILEPETIDNQLAGRRNYVQWMHRRTKRLESTLDDPLLTKPLEREARSVFEKQFLVTFEERDQIVRVLAENGQEAVGSMGDDTPLSLLSTQIRSLYDYFRQHFAQVTNPPIDPIREAVVMSLDTYLGGERTFFDEGPDHAQRLLLDSPVLSSGKFDRLLQQRDTRFGHAVIDLSYDPSEHGLEGALERICGEAVQAVRQGKVVLVLSDRHLQRGCVPAHALLATGAVHHRLIDEGLRCDANIVVATGTARDPHHFAVLLGYGATAIYPHLAYESIQGLIERGELSGIEPAEAGANYRRGINKGLLKILSKMGISTIASYRGAQLFEIVGLSDPVVTRCFKGSPSRIQGIGFDELEANQVALAREAWSPRKGIGQGGLLKYIHGGEYHAYNPDVVQSLHRAVEGHEAEAYRGFAETVNGRAPMVLRDLLHLRGDIAPIAVDDVEPAEALFPRFDTAGMSLGALSPEAHETLAEAMSRLGGRSNSGEGGEDPARYGTVRSSKIKQIASGRFGVTPHYLVNAEVLQIKIAQGAKPGEGGQLPGHKVNEMIARLRYSKPGVTLISPPPHHDIYSIEDLAQLIFDLKQGNPQALVSVKLVAEAGVGTIAVGVAKAYADLITIAGYDGGTGASPLTSVKYAGGPWELGLTETHQALVANGLRHRVRLQTDGGLKTGLDVVKAAILGAESFGFGTAPMVAMGCKYLRICHLNNCATGVATQDKVLRIHHFKPDGVAKVMQYFRMVADETRALMASLGARRLEELIGRTELLEVLPNDALRRAKLDLSPILHKPDVPDGTAQYCRQAGNPPADKGHLAERMVQDTRQAIERGQSIDLEYAVNNTQRSLGARVSGEIARRYGNSGMEATPVRVRLKGTAGQSLGVWNAGGLHIYLEGDANDYVGKGMAGGKLVLSPPEGSRFDTRVTPIMGNTCLYGATGGVLYAAGCAGERFAVRNSGAHAVVEGVGDHGCEYMTGGVVAVLGETGVNFGAGMTGGFAFVLDETNGFVDRYNHELIDIHRVEPAHMEAHRNYLRRLIEAFAQETKSAWGQRLLEDWPLFVGQFWLVKPKAAGLDELLATLDQAA